MDVPLAMPAMTSEMRSEADRVLREEFFLRGETVTEFEDEFAEFIGSDEAVAVNSGTEAIHISLRALDVGEDDTVITTPATFISTANSIIRTGADIRFVDVDLETYTMDLDHLEEVLEDTERPAAILPVDLYGYPVDVERIRDIAPDVPIVSDSCQAHGAAVHDEKVGSIADLTAFSFYPSKNMTVGGDGGMITTNDPDLATKVRSYADVGRAIDDAEYDHVRIGFTARLDTFKAAIGRVQLAHLSDWNARRTEIANQYTEAFTDLNELILPPTGSEHITPAWYFYVVRTDHRNELKEHLEECGIETGVHYPTPVHLQPPYREMGYREGDFPASEQWAEEVLSLPVHPHLDEAQVQHVISTVRSFYDKR